MTVAGQAVVTYLRLPRCASAHVRHTGKSVVGLTYDNADRRTTITLPNGNANQLLGLTYTLGQITLGTLTYAYDETGNRSSVSGTWARTGLPQAVASATYDAGNRLATWAGTSFSYDPNGNITGGGLTSYSWNRRNQLTGLSGGASASFGYDGLGRRRTKAVGGAETGLLYDGVNAVQELAAGLPTANLLTGGVDEVFQRTDGAGTRVFLSDALGTTVAIADGAGLVQTSYTYAPFGATTASGSPNANPTQFTGRENDGTGLYFYRARYYSPEWQRFVSEDSWGVAGGDVNLSAYVGNNPVGYRDPSGHIAPLLAIPAAGCIGGALGATLTSGWNARKLAAGCAAGAIIGLGAWAVGPFIAPSAFAGGVGASAAVIDQIVRNTTSIRQALESLNRAGASQRQAIDALTQVLNNTGRAVGAEVIMEGGAVVLTPVISGANVPIIQVAANGVAIYGTATVNYLATGPVVTNIRFP